MPATKPTKPTTRNPLWGSDPGQTLDPGSTKEDNGWDLNERPPARWWNWVLNALGQWSAWMEASVDELFTEKFDATSAVGAVFVGVGDQVARLVDTNAGGGDERRLWLQDAFGGNGIRVYRNDDPFGEGIEIAYGCFWLQGTGWVDDGSIGTPGVINFRAETNAIKFEQGAIVGGVLPESFTFRGDMANPGALATKRNFYPMTAVAAMGTVTTVPGSTILNVSGNTIGLNTSLSASSNDAAGLVTLRWNETKFDSADYVVIVTQEGSGTFHVANFSQSQIAANMIVRVASSGALVDLSATAVSFHFIAQGLQP